MPLARGALAHAHPAGGKAGHRVGQAARPAVGDRRWWREHDRAGQLAPCCDGGRAQVAERDAHALVGGAERQQRAVQMDRTVPAALPQQGDQALALAQRVAADHVRALGKQAHALQQARDLRCGRRMAEHRQSEGRLGDEHVAGDRLERQAGRIGHALVVAGDHDAAAVPFHRHLGAAQHMPGRPQPYPDPVEHDRLAIAQHLARHARAPGSHTYVHQRHGLRAGQHRCVAGAGMVGMRMGDDGARDRPGRIDVKAARLAIETAGQHLQPGFGVRGQGASLGADRRRSNT